MATSKDQSMPVDEEPPVLPLPTPAVGVPNVPDVAIPVDSAPSVVPTPPVVVNPTDASNHPHQRFSGGLRVHLDGGCSGSLWRLMFSTKRSHSERICRGLGRSYGTRRNMQLAVVVVLHVLFSQVLSSDATSEW